MEESGDRLPERITALEKELLELRSLMISAVDTALYISLAYAGMDPDKAKEYAYNWVDRNIKGRTTITP